MPKVNHRWYKNVLKSYSRETIVSVCITLFVLFVMAVIQLINGDVFIWHNIAPIERPDIFSRIVYSALTFISLGALLYYFRVYQFLSFVFGRNREGYRGAKKIIWFGLMWVMYVAIVPAGVNILNSIISFGYNILVLLVYVSPIAFLTLFIIAFAAVYPKILKNRN